MDLLKGYDIDISKLNLEQYEFQFPVKDEFFEVFDYGLIDHGSLSTLLVLDKKASFITLVFHIKGSIQLICDRSLDAYNYPLEINKELVLKFGEEAQELSEEMEVIPYNTQIINVARYIYEFISIEIPMKKLHPRFKDEHGDDQVIYSSSDAIPSSDVDPRWNELKKLKHKK